LPFTAMHWFRKIYPLQWVECGVMKMGSFDF
jgi:hypothetical protein